MLPAYPFWSLLWLFLAAYFIKSWQTKLGFVKRTTFTRTWFQIDRRFHLKTDNTISKCLHGTRLSNHFSSIFAALLVEFVTNIKFRLTPLEAADFAPECVTVFKSIRFRRFRPLTRPMKPYRFKDAPLLKAFSKRNGRSLNISSLALPISSLELVISEK